MAARYRDGMFQQAITRGDGNIGRRRHGECEHHPVAAAARGRAEPFRSAWRSGHEPEGVRTPECGARRAAACPASPIRAMPRPGRCACSNPVLRLRGVSIITPTSCSTNRGGPSSTATGNRSNGCSHHGFKVNPKRQRLRRHRRSAGILPRMGSAARNAALRDRRRGAEGRQRGAAASSSGYTAKAPRWAIAFKYAARQVETEVVDIVVQVGRTGALTPGGAPRAEGGGRRHGIARHAAQRRRDRAARAADRRHGGGGAQRRRDSESGARQDAGHAPQAVPHAEASAPCAAAGSCAKKAKRPAAASTSTARRG